MIIGVRMVWGGATMTRGGGRDNNIIVWVGSMMGWGNTLNLLLPNQPCLYYFMSMVQRPVGMLCSEGGVADGRAGGCRSISVYVGHGQIIIMCHVCLRGFVVVVRGGGQRADPSSVGGSTTPL